MFMHPFWAYLELEKNMNKWEMGLHSRKKKRMWVSFPYDAAVINAIKELPGCRWDAEGKVWHFPLDMQIARDIREIAKSFNAKLDIKPDLMAWARAERDRAAAIVNPHVASADLSKFLPRVRQQYPAMIEAMSEKPWQIPGASFMAAQRKTLNADDPGLGKTLQALAAIIENDISGPILVVAPKSAVGVTWPEEIERWLGENEVFYKISGDLTPEQRQIEIQALVQNIKDYPNERQWVLTGPNYLRIRADVDKYGNFIRDAQGNRVFRAVKEAIPDLFTVQWAAVIVDESHQTLASGSPGIGKRKWSAQRLGLDMLNIDPNGMRIAMSGTPFRGKTEYLYGTLQWLAPDKYTSYWNWIRRHYGVVRDDRAWGSGIRRGEGIRDERRFFQEMKPYMVRRTKGEVAKFLPPKTYGGVPLTKDPNAPIAVWLPMTRPQEAQYRDIVSRAILAFDAMGDHINVNGVLAEMIRMKQVANSRMGSAIHLTSGVEPTMPSNKIDWILDFIDDRISAGTKTIIASQFTQFLKLLSSELDRKKIQHYVFTGETGMEERKQIRTSFQSEEGDMVILLNTKSGGVSLTLDLADDVVICDQTWIPDDQIQVEDRAHRISRIHNVTIWNLASLNTIDEDIAIINAERSNAITSVLDKQRGVQYVRQLIDATKHRFGKERKSA